LISLFLNLWFTTIINFKSLGFFTYKTDKKTINLISWFFTVKHRFHVFFTRRCLMFSEYLTRGISILFKFLALIESNQTKNQFNVMSSISLFRCHWIQLHMAQISMYIVQSMQFAILIQIWKIFFDHINRTLNVEYNCDGINRALNIGYMYSVSPNCLQIVSKLSANCLQIVCKLSANCLQTFRYIHYYCYYYSVSSGSGDSWIQIGNTIKKKKN